MKLTGLQEEGSFPSVLIQIRQLTYKRVNNALVPKTNDPPTQNIGEAWEVWEIGVARKPGQNEKFTSLSTVVTIGL